jgi:hypothetical protein
MYNIKSRVKPKQKAMDFYAYITSVRKRKTRNEFIEWISMHHPRTNPYSFIKKGSNLKSNQKSKIKPKWNPSTTIRDSVNHPSKISRRVRSPAVSNASSSTVHSRASEIGFYSVCNRRQTRKDTLYTSRAHNRNGCRNVTAAECNWRSTLRRY